LFEEMNLREIDLFFEAQEEPNKGCMLALRQFLLAFHPDITEAWKWRLPFYLYKGKTFCYLWTDKKTKMPYVGIVEGGKIAHPMLIKGDRTRMKILPIDPNSDLPVEVLEEVLEEAKTFYR
jgi:hypothetical protein